MRALTIRIIVLPLMVLLTTTARPSDSQSTKVQYEFHLISGKGTPLCEGYMQLLRQTEWERPPYCDRPEPSHVDGFEPLHRVRLKTEESAALGLSATGFLNGQLEYVRQHTAQDALQLEQKRAEREQALPIETIPSAFDPPVDVDNDGVPDRIAYWSSLMDQCGHQHEINKDGSPLRVGRYAFALDSLGTLDTVKTQRLFGHPQPYKVKRKDPASGKESETAVDRFRPIVTMLTFTKFHGKYYFDGPMDPWGDFYGRRQGDSTLSQTLGVYERRGGETVERCEIRWRDRTNGK